MAGEEKQEKKEEAAPKKKPPVMIIVIAAVVVLILVGAAAAYFLIAAPKKGEVAGEGGGEAKQEQTVKHGDEEGPGGAAGTGGPLKVLDPFIVNLADAQGQRYLKAVMQFEVDNPGTDSEIASKLPQIRDEVLMILSNKTFDDVATVAGKRMLKREIVNAVNRYLSSGQVTQVYFTEFVVQ
jgi:flagellar FliL protein